MHQLEKGVNLGHRSTSGPAPGPAGKTIRKSALEYTIPLLFGKTVSKAAGGFLTLFFGPVLENIKGGFQIEPF
ncbi:MAG: hypothetical protein LBC90_07580 [Candidatus Adiutrix sp.]|jgi:hypothetical protein|nr:hypothetical protein [Candidatus Adiutrix sp.]